MIKGDLMTVLPFKDNIHQFQPLENSVILDLIIHDYDDVRTYKEFEKKDEFAFDLSNFFCVLKKYRIHKFNASINEFGKRQPILDFDI